MPLVTSVLSGLIDVSRELVSHRAFDADAAIELLDRFRLHDLDVQTLGAVKHARMAAVAALIDPTVGLSTTARLALARVTTLLDRER